MKRLHQASLWRFKNTRNFWRHCQIAWKFTFTVIIDNYFTFKVDWGTEYVLWWSSKSILKKRLPKRNNWSDPRPVLAIDHKSRSILVPGRQNQILSVAHENFCHSNGQDDFSSAVSSAIDEYDDTLSQWEVDDAASPIVGNINDEAKPKELSQLKIRSQILPQLRILSEIVCRLNWIHLIVLSPVRLFFIASCLRWMTVSLYTRKMTRNIILDARKSYRMMERLSFCKMKQVVIS